MGLFDGSTSFTPTSSRRSRIRSGRMKRAGELFAIDEWGSASEFIEKSWRTHSAPEPAFISIAASRWQMVFVTRRGSTSLSVRGPETVATVTEVPEDAEFFGIVFSLGTFMPAMPPLGLVDRAVTLPAATPTSIWLDGARWQVPGPDNVDVFVDRLVRHGLLLRDPFVAESVHADLREVSARTVQRRVARATGLTRCTIAQIARAENAVEALGRGMLPAAAACVGGYADQAHLCRSLRRFIGQTPAQVVQQSSHWSVASPPEPRRLRGG